MAKIEYFKRSIKNRPNIFFEDKILYAQYN